LFGRADGEKQQVRLVDIRGFVKIQCADAEVAACRVADWEETTERLWNAKLGYEREMLQTPDVYLCIGGKVLDYSNTLSLEQLKVIMRSEFLDAAPEEGIILVSARTEVF